MHKGEGHERDREDTKTEGTSEMACRKRCKRFPLYREKPDSREAREQSGFFASEEVRNSENRGEEREKKDTERAECTRWKLTPAASQVHTYLTQGTLGRMYVLLFFLFLIRRSLQGTEKLRDES
ncbi:hypothetical protein PROFUN_02227 [Planoprotostelium fungivorum]|uniref:Uncharacterized protein n=1 Tax=Planoprotostelium fungivorum TaxID=1890364 RepID=A0A2P6NYC5_9EUKA|nr:hypothetical protein PROFUN_02227 [Planoprotostelium fungivorum]